MQKIPNSLSMSPQKNWQLVVDSYTPEIFTWNLENDVSKMTGLLDVANSRVLLYFWGWIPHSLSGLDSNTYNNPQKDREKMEKSNLPVSKDGKDWKDIYYSIPYSMFLLYSHDPLSWTDSDWHPEEWLLGIPTDSHQIDEDGGHFHDASHSWNTTKSACFKTTKKHIEQ